MTFENVVISGCTILQNDINVVCVIVQDPPSKTKCKAGSVILVDGDGVTVTAITVPTAGATIPDPGPYSVAFASGATKVKAEGSLVLLEGDVTATINAVPQIPGAPPVAYPVSFECEITVAGQTKVKAQ